MTRTGTIYLTVTSLPKIFCSTSTLSIDDENASATIIKNTKSSAKNCKN